MTSGRKVFEKEVGKTTWLIKEMSVEDALTISTLLAKLTGSSLFTLVASIFHSKGESDLGFLDDIVNMDNDELRVNGIDDETIGQLDSLKKYSSILKKIASVFTIENKEVINEFLDKIHPKDLLFMCKTMLKDAQYIPEGTKIPENLTFDDYFTATNLGELIKVFIKCLEVNFGSFFTELLGESDQGSTQTQG